MPHFTSYLRHQHVENRSRRERKEHSHVTINMLSQLGSQKVRSGTALFGRLVSMTSVYFKPSHTKTKLVVHSKHKLTNSEAVKSTDECSELCRKGCTFKHAGLAEAEKRF